MWFGEDTPDVSPCISRRLAPGLPHGAWAGARRSRQAACRRRRARGGLGQGRRRQHRGVHPFEPVLEAGEGDAAELAEGALDGLTLRGPPSGSLLRLTDGSWVSWLPEVPDDAPFRGVLPLRSRAVAGSADPLASFADQLRGAFAALRALAYLGHEVATVTLPMIGGNRLDDIDGRARVMLQEVSRWLRAEAAATQVQAVVFYADELQVWDAAMDRALGRTLVGPGQDAVLDGLHKDVLRRLTSCASPAIASSVSALRNELQRADGQLAVHTICTFGRKRVEEMCGELLRRRGAKVHHELAKNVESLRESGVTAPWVASYMHGLRVLGNESVHERGAHVSYSPRTLGNADLVHALAAIRALLESWPG